MQQRDREAWPRRFDQKNVNGLPLPTQLIELLASGRWKTPNDALVRAEIPFLEFPIDFLGSAEAFAFESQGFLADSDRFAQRFHEYRGKSADPKPLPWLDIDLAVFIAINRAIGDDVGIALDYRPGLAMPRVVASEWRRGATDSGCFWREVTSTFSEFVTLMKL